MQKSIENVVHQKTRNHAHCRFLSNETLRSSSKRIDNLGLALLEQTKLEPQGTGLQ